jgi:hypothetical protein
MATTEICEPTNQRRSASRNTGRPEASGEVAIEEAKVEETG